MRDYGYDVGAVTTSGVETVAGDSSVTAGCRTVPGVLFAMDAAK